MPRFESFGNCTSTLNGQTVKVEIGAQVYDGWSAVVLKGPGKFFFGRLSIIGASPNGFYQWVEAGTTDPKTTSIVAHVNSSKDNENEYFIAYIEIYDPRP